MPSDPYAHIAPYYDPVTARALAGARRKMTERCLREGARHVLDVGCGTGLQTAALHEAGLRVVGLDASPAMLAAARKRLPPEVPLIQGALPLPFADAAFDATVLSLVLHETETEPETLLREALRVAPRCLVLEWRMPEGFPNLPGRLVTRLVERLAGKGHYARFQAFLTGGGLRGLASRAGAAVLDEEPAVAGLMTLALLARA